jgi:ribosome-binding protein aMBF1 (putative translation factor)
MRDLAKMIEVNELTIVNWEKGRTKPTKKNLERSRAVLGFELPNQLKTPALHPAENQRKIIARYTEGHLPIDNTV